MDGLMEATRPVPQGLVARSPCIHACSGIRIHPSIHVHTPSVPAFTEFGGQEPGTPEEIATFAKGYGAAFPMFGKIDVNGMNTHPLYKYLKEQKGELLGSDIKWK